MKTRNHVRIEDACSEYLKFSLENITGEELSMNLLTDYLKDSLPEEYKEFDDSLSEFCLLKRHLADKFCEEKDISFFNIALYHGTDEFVLDLDKETISRYRDALKKFRNIYLDHYDDYVGYIDNRVSAVCGPEIRESQVFNYGYLNVTTNPYYACNYACNTKSFFGELGLIYKEVKKAIEKSGKELEIDDETKIVLNEMEVKIAGRELSPVLLKSYDVDMICAGETGLDYDPVQLKRNYLSVAGYFRKYDGFDVGNPHLDCFRMKQEMTLKMFTVVESLKEEADLLKENRKRIKNAYGEFVDSFIASNREYFASVDSVRSKSNAEFGVAYEWETEEEEPINMSDEESLEFMLEFYPKIPAKSEDGKKEE